MCSTLMTTKFAREKELVERLVHRLGFAVDHYKDPNASGPETGVDVTIRSGGRRIGVQVTILDTGAVPGTAIAAEKAQARQALKFQGGVYGGWGESAPLDAIAATIAKKSIIDTSGFDEVWLLVSCGIPEHGAIVSTFVLTNLLTVEALTTVTSPALSQSSYVRAFLHPITALEDVLYEWTPVKQWQKHVRTRQAPEGPSFWDIQRAMKKRFRRP
jgi:hypothetical protein